MTPQELKSSILQLAVQGRLVEQRPEEGTAEELYRQIQEEKQRLIKEGKIKKEKPLHEISDDEIPFDIPESWKWVRIGSLFNVGTGMTPLKSEPKFYQNGTIPWITSSLTADRYVTKSDNYISEYALNNTPLSVYKKHTLVIAMYGQGKTRGQITELLIDATINQACAALENIVYNQNFIDYIYFYFKYNYEVIRKKAEGTSQPNLNLNKIKETIVPLPPLAEQRRIVAKIEELLPYIDRYEKAWSKLEDFNKRFPGDMQKSVLQMAIQGKLVEQRPEEGTGEELYKQIQTEKQKLIADGKIKKEKPLPEITNDEIPFDIPESWKWVRFNEVIDVRDGTHDTPKYVTNGIPLVTSKNLVDGKIDFDTAKNISIDDATAINLRSRVDDGDILFAMIGTIGNPVLVKKEREFSIKNMALFKQIDSSLLDMRYVLYFLQMAQSDMKKIANASVQSFVSLTLLRNYLFPLPPLAEQKRIVQKLDEILPFCEKLK